MTALTLPALSQESSLARYLDEVKKFPMLSEQEEHRLAVSWFEKSDIQAAQKLVTSHLRLVAKIAMQFRGYGLPLSDVISEGNVGLMIAVKKFDPYKGFRLATYAIWWIKATIQDYILKSWSIVKMGTSAAHKKLFFNLRKIKNRLFQIHQGQVPANEVELIANELDVSQEDVKEMNDRFSNYEGSLNSLLHTDGDIELIDTIAEETNDQEAALLETQEQNYKQRKFQNAFVLLSEREQNIIQERRLKEKPTTLETLSKQYGISTERVRQIEEKAMEKLQKAVAN